MLLVLLFFSLWPSSALSHIPTPEASTKKRTVRPGGAASSEWGIRGEEISALFASEDEYRSAAEARG
jgi:hypothetical protein